MKPLLIALFVFLINPARANSIKIVAIVDGEIITSYDLEQRVAITKMLNKITKIDNNSIRYLYNAVLQQMIGEKIKSKYSKNLGISISKQDLEANINLVKQNNPQYNKAFGYFKNTDTIYYLRKQIEDDITWNQIVHHYFMPRVAASDQEIQNLMVYNKSLNKTSARNMLLHKKLEQIESDVLSKVRNVTFIEINQI